jgi:hypothetical protein
MMTAGAMDFMVRWKPEDEDWRRSKGSDEMEKPGMIVVIRPIMAWGLKMARKSSQ